MIGIHHDCMTVLVEIKENLTQQILSFFENFDGDFCRFAIEISQI